MVAFTADGEPWVRAYRCADCDAVATVPTVACRRCFSRSAPKAFRATNQGRLFTWSVVERSYPGVEVPFISAIVDLDDGLALKGTLRAVDPTALREGLPVTLVFDDANGTRDGAGESYVGYHFQASDDSLAVGGDGK
jgi:uncharacterized OB-fold protein